MLVFSALTVAQAVATVCLTSLSAGVMNPSSVSNDIPSVLGSISPSLPTILDHFLPSDDGSPVDCSAAWGDSIHQDPGEYHRIYFQNIDGVRNDADELDLYVSSMAQFQVGTFCWADPSLDFSQLPVRQAIQRPLTAHFGIPRSAHSASILPSSAGITSSKTSGYQHGGTFMATTAKWATHSTGKPLSDPSGMGRWSGLCYLGKRGKRMAIITAYRSPRQQPSGGFGFYDQQYSLLLAKGTVKPNVRKQFITDLILFVNQLQSDGYEILVSLDANETPGQDAHHGISHLMDECILSDLHLSGSSAPPATYKYGSHRRIDYMLGSASVLESIRHAGYLEYDDGVFSKHRGLFVDLDFQSLMGSVTKSNLPELEASALRIKLRSIVIWWPSKSMQRITICGNEYHSLSRWLLS
jgi:hypothetical protein